MYYIDEILDDESEKNAEIELIIGRYGSLEDASPFAKVLGYHKSKIVLKIIKKIMIEKQLVKKTIRKSAEIFDRLLIKKYIYIFSKIDPESALFSSKLLEMIFEEEDLSSLYEIIRDEYYDDSYWDKYKDEERLLDIVSMEMKSNTDVICRNCGGEVYVETIQTRSCDEGVTNFYTCLTCQKRWKS